MKQEDTFDFKLAGYESPGDWARLRDLVPDTVKAKELRALEKGGDRKEDLLALLARHGVGVSAAYDAEAARTRNTKGAP